MYKSQVCPICHKKKNKDFFTVVRRIQICWQCYRWISGAAKKYKVLDKVPKPKQETALTRRYCDCGEVATVIYLRELICQRCKDLSGQLTYWATKDFDGIEGAQEDYLPQLAGYSFPSESLDDRLEHAEWIGRITLLKIKGRETYLNRWFPKRDRFYQVKRYNGVKWARFKK